MLHKDMKMCQFDLFRIIDGSKRPLGPGLIDFCWKKCLITEPYVERPLFEQSAPPPPPFFIKMSGSANANINCYNILTFS